MHGGIWLQTTIIQKENSIGSETDLIARVGDLILYLDEILNGRMAVHEGELVFLNGKMAQI